MMSDMPDGQSKTEATAMASEQGANSSGAVSVGESSAGWWDDDAGNDLLLAID